MTDSRNLKVGAEVGLAAGAGTGYALRNILANKELTKQASELAGEYATEMGTYVTANLTGDLYQKAQEYGTELLESLSSNDKFVKNSAKLAENPQDINAATKLGRIFKKTGAKIMGKPEYKEYKEATEKLTTQFNEGEGKELFSKMKNSVKKLNLNKAKWIAGIAAAGALIGVGIAYLVNKSKKTAEKTENNNN